jgi:hypothetical protein
VGELALVGVTTKQQILDVFNLTKTLDKDSRISFFKEYFEIQKQYSFSREALEEIYLVYTERAAFILNPENNLTIREVKNPTMTKNPGCTLYMNSCEFEFEIPKKDGYNLGALNILFNGNIVAGGSASYPVYLEIAGKKIAISNIMSLKDYVLPEYLVKYKGKIYISGFDVGSLVSAIASVGDPKLEYVYEPIVTSNTRESFGELSQVSTEQKLDASYVEEINSKTFNVGTTSTSTVWKTSSIALSELASSSITTVQQIKDLFENASTTNFGKDAKLYFAWKKVKDTKNISLSRLTLEEMWKISLDEQLLQGATTVSTTQTVTALPTSLLSELNYKMNGTVGSVDKKKDEVRSDKPIFAEVNVTTANGRTNDTNGAYQFNSGYLKLPNHTPAITNNPQTYSLWYKGTGGETLINLTSKGTRNFMSVWFYQGKLLPEIGWTNGGGYVALIGNKVVTDNVWHKVDMVVENINNKAVIKLYIDGELDMDSRSQPHNNGTAMNLSNISNEINLGATENYASGNMQAGMSGIVDDFKLYNKFNKYQYIFS